MKQRKHSLHNEQLTVKETKTNKKVRNSIMVNLVLSNFYGGSPTIRTVHTENILVGKGQDTCKTTPGLLPKDLYQSEKDCSIFP